MFSELAPVALLRPDSDDHPLASGPSISRGAILGQILTSGNSEERLRGGRRVAELIERAKVLLGLAESGEG